MEKTQVATNNRWIVSQIGAREHYAVALGLLQNNILNRLYTDYWSGPFLRSFARIRPFKKICGRFSSDIPANIVSHPSIAWNLKMRFRQRACRSISDRFTHFCVEGRSFCEFVNRDIEQRQSLHNTSSIFFGYHTASLETMELLKSLGVFCVLDQMDPGRTHYEIVRDECKKWPGWQENPIEIPEEYFHRMEKEWDLSSLIVVNSDWSRNCLIKQGVASNKIVIVPLGYQVSALGPSAMHPKEKFGATKDFNVLWAAHVSLGKGIPYLLEAARSLLPHRRIRFLVAGEIAISRKIIEKAPSNVRFLGRLPQTDMKNTYSLSHLFVNPTLSDGFALTQLEAMAHKLPVISTPCCGQVVEHGKDGLIIPPANSKALADSILQCFEDPSMMIEMSENAWRKSQQFSIPSVTSTLLKLIGHQRQIIKAAS